MFLTDWFRRMFIFVHTNRKRPPIPPPVPPGVEGLGLFYLAPTYRTEPPINPVTQGGVTNSHMIGSLWRQTWNKLTRSGQGQYDWTFLDACFNAAESHGKSSALQITSGQDSPAWFFALPNAKQIIVGTDSLPTSVPWDPVFLTEWTAVQTAIAARYKNRSSLKYLKIQGPGNSSESFFAITPEEIAAADALAQDMGYTNANEAWQVGVRQLIDMYVSVWDPIPVQMVMGAPFAHAEGSQEALLAMFDYGAANYQGKFGAVAHDLTSQRPHADEISATVIQDFSPHCSATGYQFGNHQLRQDPHPPSHLDSALLLGTGYGAHMIEIFGNDADDSRSAPVLDDANIRMGV